MQLMQWKHNMSTRMSMLSLNQNPYYLKASCVLGDEGANMAAKDQQLFHKHPKNLALCGWTLMCAVSSFCGDVVAASYCAQLLLPPTAHCQIKLKPPQLL